MSNRKPPTDSVHVPFCSFAYDLSLHLSALTHARQRESEAEGDAVVVCVQMAGCVWYRWLVVCVQMSGLKDRQSAAIRQSLHCEWAQLELACGDGTLALNHYMRSCILLCQVPLHYTIYIPQRQVPLNYAIHVYSSARSCQLYHILCQVPLNIYITVPGPLLTQ